MFCRMIIEYNKGELPLMDDERFWYLVTAARRRSKQT